MTGVQTCALPIYSKTRLVLTRLLRNQIGKIVSSLEIIKERFLICKKKNVQRCGMCVLEKRIKVLEKMEAKKLGFL